MAKDKKELESGWAVAGGDIYHFGHVSAEWAEEKLHEGRDRLYAVDVIHMTITDDGGYHLNSFLVMGYENALARACQVQMAPYPDYVIGIRPAVAGERIAWDYLTDHYHDALFPEALSLEQAAELAKDADELGDEEVY